MGFYDYSKEKRKKIVQEMENNIKNEIEKSSLLETSSLLKYSSDEDIYIRKNAYLIVGRLYNSIVDLRHNILHILKLMYQLEDLKIKQTVIYAWAEIGKNDFDKIINNMENALKEGNPKLGNSIIGALKKLGEKNPSPTLKFAKKYINDPNPEIRRQIIHGIELRGRTQPEDILPLLEEVENEENKRVRDMIIHVIGQISYKKGCLEKVIFTLKHWKNKKLVDDALYEILDVHKRYKFSYHSYRTAEQYIRKEFNF
ncbi:MAG: HEAT repeat domain-containing protein [Methanobacteriaceae archaeon]|nr:HEAT repeat domain-containing protein [Methanobacteriaceae archaeon]